MMRGSRRGCVRLKGACIGIDDEDDSTFTINVDDKVFHFQARDADEKERWIDALDNTIIRHSRTHKRKLGPPVKVSVTDFDRKLAEADAYLQLLIAQHKTLEGKTNDCTDDLVKAQCSAIKVSFENTIEAIKQSIVGLQIAKQNMLLMTEQSSPRPVVDESNMTMEVSETQSLHPDKSQMSEVRILSKSSCDLPESDLEETLTVAESTSLPILPTKESDLLHPSSTPPMHISTQSSITSATSVVPEMSYSSSEDEDFFDADEGLETPGRPSTLDDLDADNTEVEEPRSPVVLIRSDDDVFDELYDDTDDEELESLDQHGSIVAHLLSQVHLGMDLTKIVLPTFILERRSLLEMFADFIAHPDLFVAITEQPDPRSRMIQTLRWYMSAFHAGRRSSVAKKPYNPILGETFQCYYDLPNEPPCKETVPDGPISGATKNNVTYISEQVSHHPPISAYYAEHYNKRIAIDGYTWTKSKFLGLSIGVEMIGRTVISVLDHDEEYILTVPNGYGRSILTVPWVELGGKTSIQCPQTGYYANIVFHTKPFYGGKKDRVTAEVFAPNDKRNPICSIQGEWNGVMVAKYDDGTSETFVDTKTMPIVKKRVKTLDEQTEYESRRLWKDVTKHLKDKNVEKATEYKRFLEQRQRDEAKERKEHGLKWQTKHFHEVGENWVYDRSLVKRLSSKST